MPRCNPIQEQDVGNFTGDSEARHDADRKSSFKTRSWVPAARVVMRGELCDGRDLPSFNSKLNLRGSGSLRARLVGVACLSAFLETVYVLWSRDAQKAFGKEGFLGNVCSMFLRRGRHIRHGTYRKGCIFFITSPSLEHSDNFTTQVSL